MEDLAIFEKRLEVQDQVRRNQLSCRKALSATDLSGAGRATHTIRKVTMPQEFSFSSQHTTRPRSADVDSSGRRDSSCDSVRDASSGKATGSQTHRQWRPQLTVPRGPELRTVQRLGGSSSAAALQRSTTPGRREERSSASSARPSTPRRGEAVPAAALERAQQARLLAQRKKDEQARATNEMVSIFKRQTSQRASASSSAKQPTRQVVQTPSEWRGSPPIAA